LFGEGLFCLFLYLKGNVKKLKHFFGLFQNGEF